MARSFRGARVVVALRGPRNEGWGRSDDPQCTRIVFSTVAVTAPHTGGAERPAQTQGLVSTVVSPPLAAVRHNLRAARTGRNKLVVGRLRRTKQYVTRRAHSVLGTGRSLADNAYTKQTLHFFFFLDELYLCRTFLVEAAPAFAICFFAAASSPYCSTLTAV